MGGSGFVVDIDAAGMVSDAKEKAIEAAGLSFIIGARVPALPYIITAWQTANPGVEFTHQQVWVQPWPDSPTDNGRDHTFYYQYRAGRARRTLHSIGEQVKKAEQAVAGKASVKRNRFVQISGGTKALNEALVARSRSLAGIKGYVTNLPDPTAGTVIAAYHQLCHVEKAFRMSKHDLQARPIYHPDIRPHPVPLGARKPEARELSSAPAFVIGASRGR